MITVIPWGNGAWIYMAMRAFIRVAEAHSFSGVARELKVAQSTVSKQISVLEEHLGARLVNRTTRTLSDYGARI